ncbi:MAG: HAD family hydrolase [Kiritimatiellae bacterium]|nr:HAD family hydrolase [Kiritimatiellia bacterium]
MSYRHVIWDWNGTLFDDAWLCVEIINGMLPRYGRPPVTPEQYEAAFEFPVINYYRKIGFDFSANPFEEVATEFMTAYDRRRRECRLRAHARGALDACAAAGMEQSILSAYPQGALEEVVAAFGLRGLFRQLVGLGDHYAGGKLENGKRLIEGLGLPGGEVVLIGDTVHDFEVAQAMGTHCALIPSGHHTRARLEPCGVPVLDSLADVPALVVNRHQPPQSFS